jgi:hypothetical protein
MACALKALFSLTYYGKVAPYLRVFNMHDFFQEHI